MRSSSLLQARKPQRGTGHLGPVSIFGVKGNPACWHDIFDFDYCCDRRHGPRGVEEHETECLATLMVMLFWKVYSGLLYH